MTTKITPKAIYDEMSKDYLGNEAAKRALTAVGYVHAASILHKKRSFGGRVAFTNSGSDLIPDSINNNLLLLGKSGSGKTFGVQTLAKVLSSLTGVDIPLKIVDCASLTPSGFVGNGLEDELGDFFTKQAGAAAPFSIVVFDEFDKITMEFGSGSSPDFYKRIQYSMLRLVEGADYLAQRSTQSLEKINTKNMLFIFSGNFPSIRHAREEREKGISTYGFGTVSTDDGEKEEETLLDQMSRELEEAGVASQLVGRISAVAETEALTEELMEQILRKQLVEYACIAPDNPEVFEFTDEEVTATVKSCIGKDTGVRAMNARINAIVFDRILNKNVAFTPEHVKNEEKAREAAQEAAITDDFLMIDYARCTQIIEQTLMKGNCFSKEIFRRLCSAAYCCDTYEDQKSLLAEVELYCQETADIINNTKDDEDEDDK